MSCIQREVGETLGSIFLEIPENLEDLSVEDMKRILRNIKTDAKQKYAEYAYHMGWADSEEEAIQNLQSEQDHSKEVEERNPYTRSLLVIAEWLSKKHGIPQEIDVHILMESEKAVLTTIYGWIPKSQIKSKRDIEWKQYPPHHECVPWFHEHLKSGDHVKFNFDGGLGGVRSVEGIVDRLEYSELYVNGNSYLMGYIGEVIKFVKQEEKSE